MKKYRVLLGDYNTENTRNHPTSFILFSFREEKYQLRMFNRW